MFDNLNKKEDDKKDNNAPVSPTDSPVVAGATSQASLSNSADRQARPNASVGQVTPVNQPPSVQPLAVEQPTNKPPKPAGEVEDMFSETDQAVKPSAFQPKHPVSGEGSVELIKPNLKSKILFLGLIMLGVILLGVGGFFGFKLLFNDSGNSIFDKVKSYIKSDSFQEEDNNADNNSSQNNPVPDNNPPPVKKDTIPEIAPPPVNIDSDGDGLTDEEERTLGTNINNADSDGDGLFDREEVKVYKTDPLNPDTDGDGYTDGDEVKNKFNPKGAGKLYNIK